MPIRVAIAEDHLEVQRGLARMIGNEQDMKAILECGTGAELIEGMKHQCIDVVILDISLPDASGMDLISAIRELSPSTAVLMLSMHAPEQMAALAMSAGASGYLTKESAPEELIVAIRTVLSGRPYLNGADASALASAVEQEANIDPPPEALSERERQVLRLYVNRATLLAISEQLGLSLRTVTGYKDRALEKLKFKTDTELIAWAARRNLVQGSQD